MEVFINSTDAKINCVKFNFIFLLNQIKFKVTDYVTSTYNKKKYASDRWVWCFD